MRKSNISASRRMYRMPKGAIRLVGQPFTLSRTPSKMAAAA
jgi:hypothetical protein